MFLRFFVLLAAGAALLGAADVRVVEEIVAKVNGEIITRTELERTRQELEAEALRQGLTGAKYKELLAQAVKDALRDQIDTMLLVQRGKDLNINVDPDVTKQIAEIQSKSKLADPDKFHEWLRQQVGMSFEDYRQRLKNDLLRQRVIGQEIAGRITISDAEKRKYYEEHKKEFVREEQVFLRQILISTEGKSPEQVAAAEKKAKDVLARARRGDKFADLARDFSDDYETSTYGGELPGYKKGMLRPEIEAAVFKQRKGFVSDVIRVPNGFLILKVEERFEPGLASFEEVEPEITNRLAGPKMEPKIREYLTKLRQDAFLEIRAGYVDSGAAPGKDTSWKDPAQLKPETTTKEEVEAHRKRRLLWIIPRGSAAPNEDKIKSSEPKAPAPAAPAAAAKP